MLSYEDISLNMEKWVHFVDYEEMDTKNKKKTLEQELDSGEWSLKINSSLVNGSYYGYCISPADICWQGIL